VSPAISSDAILAIPFQLVFFATFGAFVLYLLNRLQERRPFSLFSGLNIDVGIKAKPHIILIDMLISSLLGGVLVIALSSPESIPQSLLGGLGLTGLLSPFSQNMRGPNQ
jgi:hypothetical protein